MTQRSPLAVTACALAAFLLLAAAVAAGSDPRPLKETEITVRGMICSSCSAAVEKALGKISGVTEVRVDQRADLARVKYDGTRVTPQQMVEAIRKAGYQARWPRDSERAR